jgi:fucose 4-O-acetylase-like acetyltransferase
MASKPPTAAAKLRDNGVESLRGLLILCVVLGHLPLSLILAGRETGTAAAIWAWSPPVYAFHIPAFLALSCLFVPAWDWRWMGKRALLLLVPYLLWLARPSFFFDPVGDLRRLYEAQKALPYGNWAWDHSILWFLPALLACNAVVAGLARLSKPWAWALALLGAALIRWQMETVVAWHVAGKVPYSLDVAVYFAPLFLAARELYDRRNWTLGRPWWFWAAVFAAGVALIQLFEPVKTHTVFHWRVDLAQFSVPVTVAGILGCAAAVLGLLAAFAGRQGLAWMAWLGKRSLPIYLMHYYFLTVGWEALKARPAWIESEAALALAPILMIAVAVLAPCAISWAARRLSPYARYAGMEA